MSEEPGSPAVVFFYPSLPDMLQVLEESLVSAGHLPKAVVCVDICSDKWLLPARVQVVWQEARKGLQAKVKK